MPCISSSSRLIKCFAPHENGFKTLCDIKLQENEFFHLSGTLFAFHRIDMKLVSAHTSANEIIKLYDKHRKDSEKELQANRRGLELSTHGEVQRDTVHLALPSSIENTGGDVQRDSVHLALPSSTEDTDGDAQDNACSSCPLPFLACTIL